MKKMTIAKRILGLTLCFALGMAPMTALATSYNGNELTEVHFESFVGIDTDAMTNIRVCVTDENAITVKLGNRMEKNFYVFELLWDQNAWYFDEWQTWYHGFKDQPIIPDKEVDAANPKFDDEDYYYFFDYTYGQDTPYIANDPVIGVSYEPSYYGTYSLYAIFKPIVTINADEGVTYTVDTPAATEISDGKIAVKYLDDVTINYQAKEGYELTGVSASGTKDIDTSVAGTIKLNDTEKPTSVSIHAQPKQETVRFNANGGAALDPITVTYGEKYGTLPSSAITGLSGGDSNWYLMDESGAVTDTKITRLSKVAQPKDHTLFVKRKVLAPTVSISLAVPDGISDGYQYYIPENSTRILTAKVGNQNTDVLDYTYQWYKGDTPIDGANEATLTLAGNVADSGTYKVKVTATLKAGTDIIVTADSASAEKTQTVKILHAANTIYYDANGGEDGPSSNYTGGASLTVSNSQPTRENYIFNGWNTRQDGTGTAYSGGDTYTFAEDNGNGGCSTTLYAQWTPVTYTVTYVADGETVKTEQVAHGKDATEPEPPAKIGYTAVWDKDGKNITENTTIEAVYTLKRYTITYVADGETVATYELDHGAELIPPALPEKEGYIGIWEQPLPFATADAEIHAVYIPKTYTITFMVEGRIFATQTRFHGEPIEPPAAPQKDGYTVYWSELPEIATRDVTIHAIYGTPPTQAPSEPSSESTAGEAAPHSPQTGDASNLWLWVALLFISGGLLIGALIGKRKES